ncbi:MAG: hypothetical protein ACI8W3_001189, partial [Myxococcota bacterium]
MALGAGASLSDVDRHLARALMGPSACD